MHTPPLKPALAAGITVAATLAAAASFAAGAAAPTVNREPPTVNPGGGSAAAAPNIVMILVDDMGYGDIEPFGSVKNRTPNLNRMAAEGLKLTSFYTAPVCTPSRAQVMTGCYAKRVSLPNVIGPMSPIGISPREHTVADLLKKQGYATMAIGKWHLGDQREFLPTHHGFDTYFGLPYSNDMDGGGKNKKGHPPLPLIQDTTPIQVITPADQDHLEERYTAAAVKFIRAHAGGPRPFFLYLAHTAVHCPIHPGPNFKGKSANGRYGDWVEEVDWSTGQVMDTLRELGIAGNTLVFFTSDNGPWLIKKSDAGTAGPLRGGKGGTFEGGVREPTLVWWPGKVPAGVTLDTIAGTVDLLPTFVSLAGGAVPKDNKIDGVDISPMLLGKTAESTRKANYYFAGNNLQAVRVGPWKLAITNQDDHWQERPFKIDPNFVPHLYNLDTDIGERHDVAAQHPDIVKQLLALTAAMDKDLGKKEKGPGVRAPGRVSHPVGLWVVGQEPSKETLAAYYDVGEPTE